jgi:2-phospho-L-lactate guanylyltransferase (CobY/MobA/RfbA family)
MNAIAVEAPIVVRPAFGVPGAADATIKRARTAGLGARVVDEPTLAFDVDHPPDVWKLRESGRASRARASLEAILPPTAGLL